MFSSFRLPLKVIPRQLIKLSFIHTLVNLASLQWLSANHQPNAFISFSHSHWFFIFTSQPGPGAARDKKILRVPIRTFYVTQSFFSRDLLRFWRLGYPVPGVPQTPKLCFTKNVQVGDLISLNFFRAAPGPSWLVNIKIVASRKVNH